MKENTNIESKHSVIENSGNNTTIKNYNNDDFPYKGNHIKTIDIIKSQRQVIGKLQHQIDRMQDQTDKTQDIKNKLVEILMKLLDDKQNAENI